MPKCRNIAKSGHSEETGSFLARCVLRTQNKATYATAEFYAAHLNEPLQLGRIQTFNALCKRVLYLVDFAPTLAAKKQEALK